MKFIKFFIFLILPIFIINSCFETKPDIFFVEYPPNNVFINSNFKVKVGWTYAFSSNVTAKISTYDPDGVKLDTKEWAITAGSGGEKYIDFYCGSTYLAGLQHKIKIYTGNPSGSKTSLNKESNSGKIYSEAIFNVQGSSTNSITISSYNNEYRPQPISDGFDTKYEVGLTINMDSNLRTASQINIGCVFVDENNEEYKFNSVEYDVKDISFDNFSLNLEYGGSLPVFSETSSTFQLKAELSTGPINNSTNYAYSSTKEVTVYNFDKSQNSLTHNLELEYDSHSSTDFCSEEINEKKLLEKLNTAFIVAGLDLSILYQNREIADNYLDIQENKLADFARDNDIDLGSGFDYRPHIIFLRYLLKEKKPHDPILATTGTSSSNLEFDGYWHRYSYIFMGSNNMDLQFTVILTIIHELGHQIAGLRHASGSDPYPKEHDSPFCIMNQGLFFKYQDNVDNDNNSYNNEYYPKWSFYLNPHFCEICLNNYNNINW